jgi:hypothetical protein
MMRSLHFFLLLLIFSLFAAPAKAQVKFSAQVSPSQIFKDEYATVRIELENATDIQQLRVPNFTGFKVLSGPNQETGMSTVNGVSKTYVAFNFVIQPLKPGKFSFGNVSVQIAGKKYSSGPLKITVKNGQARSYSGQPQAGLSSPFFDPMEVTRPPEAYSDYILRKGEHVADKVNKNMQLRLQCNKTNCYVGEPIVATYKLFTRLKSESKMTKAPSFNGFSVIDLLRPDESEYSKETLNGKQYNVYTVRKSQLYPLQDGDVELEAASLDNEVQFIREEAAQSINVDGFFNGFGISPDAVVTQAVTLISKPQMIHVKPLPLAGKPAGFNGAVGKFEIDAFFEKTSFSSSESGKLTINISGAGNLQLLTAPDIIWPKGMEGFDAVVKENIDTRQVPLSGTKAFEIPFTVDSEGSYQVPPIQFSYFDPQTESYHTISTKALPFTVTKGNGISSALIDSGSIVKKSVPFSKQLEKHGVWIIGIIALLLIFLLYRWQQQKAKIRKQKIIQQALAIKQRMEEDEKRFLAARPQNPLNKTEACLNSPDCTGFYELLNAELKAWLGEKFQLNMADISSKKITLAMDKAGIDIDSTLEMETLLQQIEWELYTPDGRDEFMRDRYAKAQSLIQTINRYQPATL